MEPTFTVGIPVYNGMPYLKESLESVLQQTYRNFEIVVVNDGSTDDTLKYLTSIRDRRLRVITQPNGGITTALNRILAEACSPWLVRLDADDIAAPDRLSVLNDAIRQHPQAGMFYSDAVNHGHGRAIGKLRTIRGTPEELRGITKKGYLLSICHVTAALNVAKTRAIGGYRFNLYVEDLDLWWRMALQHDIVFVPHVSVAVRLREDSTCISNLEKLTVNTSYVQYLLLSHLWDRNPLDYETVAPLLGKAIDRRGLQYRQEMWLAGGDIGAQRYSNALIHLLNAFINSPSRFVGRSLHPLFPRKVVRRGEDPARFRRLEHQLWNAETVLREVRQ